MVDAIALGDFSDSHDGVNGGLFSLLKGECKLGLIGGTPPAAFTIFLYFERLFWNQIFTCVWVSPSSAKKKLKYLKMTNGNSW